MLLVAATSCISLGCASLTQTQYFEVVSPPDPETGEATRNYYKMTITGRGDLLNTYQMNAAYVSKAALDVLRGQGVSIPIVDIPEKNLEKFEAIKTHLLMALENQAKAHADAAGVYSSTREQEEEILAIARQLWYASLSDSDLISMGEVENADPYEFRRLVFYSSAKNIKFEQVASEIDSIISDVETIARNARERKEAEKAAQQQQRQTLLTSITTWADNIPPEYKPSALAILNIIKASQGLGGEGE